MSLEQDVASLHGRIASLERRQRFITLAGLATAVLACVCLTSGATFAQDRPEDTSDVAEVRQRFHALMSDRASVSKSVLSDAAYAAGTFVLLGPNDEIRGGLGVLGDGTSVLSIFDRSETRRIALGVDAAGAASIQMFDHRGRRKVNLRTK